MSDQNINHSPEQNENANPPASDTQAGMTEEQRRFYDQFGRQASTPGQNQNPQGNQQGYANGQQNSAPPPPPPAGGYGGAPSYDIDGVPHYEVSTFIQKNAHYYLPKFYNMSQGRKASWNWVAFFFPGYWMLYRRMIKEFFIYLAFDIASRAVSLYLTLTQLYNLTNTVLPNIDRYSDADYARYASSLLGTSAVSSVISLASLLVSVFIGIYANYLYYRSAMRKISAITVPRSDPYGRSAALGSAGGVKTMNYVIYLICTVVYAIVIFAITFSSIFSSALSYLPN